MSSSMNPDCVETWNLSDTASAHQTLHYLEWSFLDKLIITILIPIFVVVGVLANLAFTFTVARISRMRTVTNYYLVNLSIADILFMLIMLGSYIRTYLQSPFRNNVPYTSEYGCWAKIYPMYLSYFASVLIITLVALERYFTICMPVKHRLISGKKRSIKLIIICWVLSFILAALTTPRYGQLKQKCIIWPDEEEFQHFPTTYRTCYFLSEAWALTSEFVQLIIFTLALIVSCFTYYKLMRALRKSRPLSWTGKSIRGERDKQLRKQVARLLMINGTVFFLCQFPARAINMDKVVRVINGNLQPYFATLFAIANGLLLLNSAINPFIYGLSSRFYRVAFCKAFGIAAYLRMDRSMSTSRTSTISRSMATSVRTSTFRDNTTEQQNNSQNIEMISE